MPKRSNQFQRVVTYVAEKLAPIGATVRESVELPERGLDGVVREVDTLIEVQAGITLVRVAIECRDRTRKDVVSWVDELIGKYKNLSVDRVVAVSNSGFSEAAKAKAALNGIELLTPEEVEGVDWPGRFQKIGVGTVAGEVRIEHVEFKTTPPFPGKVDLDRDRVLREGTGKPIHGTVRRFVEELGPHFIERARRHHREKFLSIYKARADLEKIAIIDIPLPMKDVWLVSGISRFRVDALSVRVLIAQRLTVVPMNHAGLGENAMVSSATFDGIALSIAQAAKATEGKVFLERVRPKVKTRTKRTRRATRKAAQPH